MWHNVETLGLHVNSVYHGTFPPSKAFPVPGSHMSSFQGKSLPNALFFLSLHQCQWSIKAYRECTLSNLLSVCAWVRLWECVFTLWGCSLLESQGCFRSHGFSQLRVFLFVFLFFWLQHLFYYWQAKLFCALLPQLFSKQFLRNFVHALQPLNLHKHNTNASTATQRYTKPQKRAEHFRKDRMMKSPEKINHYISLVL